MLRLPRPALRRLLSPGRPLFTNRRWLSTSGTSTGNGQTVPLARRRRGIPPRLHQTVRQAKAKDASCSRRLMSAAIDPTGPPEPSRGRGSFPVVVMRYSNRGWWLGVSGRQDCGFRISDFGFGMSQRISDSGFRIVSIENRNRKLLDGPVSSSAVVTRAYTTGRGRVRLQSGVGSWRNR